MKKRICFLLAACMLFMLCAAGCGNAQNTGEPDIVLSDVMAEIRQKVDMPEMMDLTRDNLPDYIGVDPADLSDFAACVNANGYEAEQIILLRVSVPENVPRVLDAMNAYHQNLAAQMENYLPEQYDMIVKSSAGASGTYVWLFISPEKDQMQSILDEYLK